MAPINADDPMMDNLFGFCEELDMPVLIHIALRLTKPLYEIVVAAT